MPPPLSEKLWESLATMLALAQRQHGYLRLGVRGWACTDDLALLLGRRAAEHLPMLLRRGYLDREDVSSAPGVRHIWIYRVNERGRQKLAETGDPPGEATCLRDVPLPRPNPDAPDKGAVYLSARALVVLRALREILERSRLDAPGKETHGWGSVQEIRDRVQAGRGRGSLAGALAWLVRMGLVERTSREGARGAGDYLYRATPVGALVAPLEWEGPREPPEA